MIPTASHDLIIILSIITFTLIAALLVFVFVLSTSRQQRRYLRTREHLGGRLLTAQDEERAAIARELHDDTVQQLIAVASRLRATDAVGDVEAAKELDCIIEGLRGIARGIHPAIVDHAGLGPALASLCATFPHHEEVVVTYEGPTEADDLTSGGGLALYRVAQEALGNVARHAEVDRARLALSMEPGLIRLLIEDQGRGCDLRSAETGPGIGITSMRERLEILGGALQVESSPGKGTRITATLPTGRDSR